MTAGDLNQKLPPSAETSAVTKNDKERSRKSSHLQVWPSLPMAAAEWNSGMSPSVVNSSVCEENGEKPTEATNMLAETFEKVLNIKFPSATSSNNDAPPAADSLRAYTPLPDCPVQLPLPIDLGSRKTSTLGGFGTFGAFGSNKGDGREDRRSVSSQYTTLDLATLTIGSNVPKKNALSTLPLASIPWKVPPTPVERSESSSSSSEGQDENDSDASTPSRTPPHSIAALSGSRKKFVKPAPQCYHWKKSWSEHSRFNCQFFHPREPCKYFPRCPFGAEKCGFGHPFCAPYCKCRSFEQSRQYNHRYMPQGEREESHWRDEELGSARRREMQWSSPARMKTEGGAGRQSQRASTKHSKIVTGSNRLALSHQTHGGGGGGNWMVKKRAPQCVYWSDPNHDASICHFWHPRLQCKYYPKCSTGAEKCTFAHPFCSRGFCKCEEEEKGRSSQLNHRARHFKNEEDDEED